MADIVIKKQCEKCKHFKFLFRFEGIKFCELEECLFEAKAEMKVQEAIDILEDNWTKLVSYNDYTDEQLGEAQDMAIKALKKMQEEGD